MSRLFPVLIASAALATPALAGKGGTKGPTSDKGNNGNGNAYGHCDDSEDDHDKGIGNDEGGPHGACEVVCPCFDAADLDADFSGWSLYTYTWAVRSSGLTDVYSQRGYTWTYDSDLGQWTSPTIGADAWYDGSQAWCGTWSETWLAAPDHAWAGDYVGSSVAITDEEYDVCHDVLSQWTTDNGSPVTSW